ncbi:hypothetical protein CXR26_01325 [Brevibacterium aurantiacum]|nr:hypothetical protein CXR26_01325 [Brevibacterium aurantiacum]
MHCSKSTIYSVAPMKEQLVVAVTKRFFRLSTTRIEESISGIHSGRLPDDTGLEADQAFSALGERLL